MRKVFDGILLMLALAAVALWGGSYLRGRAPPSKRQRPTIDQLEAKVVGTTLLPLSLSTGSETRSRSFDPAGSPSLLLILSSTCPACIQTAPVWRVLLDSMPPQIRTVALSREPLAVLRDWTSSHRLPVDFTFGDAATSTWGVMATPTTMLVNDRGRVLLAHVGNLD